MQDISLQLGACFNHILREANVMADALAREGVFLSSPTFDVGYHFCFVGIFLFFFVFCFFFVWAGSLWLSPVLFLFVA